jgi:hypothetical protein
MNRLDRLVIQVRQLSHRLAQLEAARAAVNGQPRQNTGGAVKSAQAALRNDSPRRSLLGFSWPSISSAALPKASAREAAMRSAPPC